MLDYDVVIIGGNLAGRYAALEASRLKARVALVEPAHKLGETGNFYPKTFIELTRQSFHQNRQQNPIISLSTENKSSQFDDLYKNINRVIFNLEEIHSLSSLAQTGVDVILGKGKFIKEKSQLVLRVNERELRSRAYLLSLPSQPIIPDIPGLDSTGYLTYPTIDYLLKDEKLPKNIIIIGSDPCGIEIAQTCVRLGISVTIIVNKSHILPGEDSQAAFLIQAALEAEGIKIITNTEVIQTQKIEDKKWVQAGDKALESDEIVLAPKWGVNLDMIDLDVTGIKIKNHQFIVNDKLQTFHPKIYACQEVTGGYLLPSIAQYEVNIALKNILFFPIHKTDYLGVPWAFFSEPELARVGLTEAQAREKYGRNVIVAIEYFKHLEISQIRGELTGFFQLIAHKNGKILGSLYVGSQGRELIHTIALAMSQGIKINTLAEMPFINSSVCEIIQKTAKNCQSQLQEENLSLSNFLENWFHFRRCW
jgi:pyruvate/2-oxoglutarate dehydrogenase complex dihydrolipoamide dehydrogenase (E3) component